MDFKLSEREDLLRKSAREFAESEITPRIEAMEESGDFPGELLKPMAKLGITGLIAPPEYGGVGLGYLARTIVLEELARVSAAESAGFPRTVCAWVKGIYATLEAHPEIRAVIVACQGDCSYTQALPRSKISAPKSRKRSTFPPCPEGRPWVVWP